MMSCYSYNKYIEDTLQAKEHQTVELTNATEETESVNERNETKKKQVFNAQKKQVQPNQHLSTGKVANRK